VYIPTETSPAEPALSLSKGTAENSPGRQSWVYLDRTRILVRLLESFRIKTSSLNLGAGLLSLCLCRQLENRLPLPLAVFRPFEAIVDQR
jgi:hypothetical protein